ncbi:MAG: DUF924 family protein [Pseudomonadota bacterium]
MTSPEEVLEFWLDELGPSKWYKASDELDTTIRDRFENAWQNALEGTYGLWLTYPSGTLAYILLMDQFPRNMFRNDPRSFEADQYALAASKLAIQNGWDTRIDEPARQFFYLPLMHSENLCDQERCIRLLIERMPETGAENLFHARAHREVIRQFGRFPYRNSVLSRASTGSEQTYLKQGGYGSTVRELQAVAAQ